MTIHEIAEDGRVVFYLDPLPGDSVADIGTILEILDLTRGIVQVRMREPTSEVIVLGPKPRDDCPVCGERYSLCHDCLDMVMEGK